MLKLKIKHKYEKKYSEESVQKALNEIKNGASKKAAALEYGTPRATLQFRLSEKLKKTEQGLQFLQKKKNSRWLIGL